MRIGSLTILLVLFLAPILAAQGICRVQSDLTWSTSSGKFTFDATIVTVTIPRFLERSQPLTVSLEVAGPPQAGIFIESLGKRVAVTDGAVLALQPQHGVRIDFSLVNSDGSELCKWNPLTDAPRGNPRGPSGIPPYYFRVGDPLALRVPEDAEEFRIGGVLAKVLARSPALVILRDPQPAIGSRTVSAKSYSTQLRFITIDKQLTKGRSQGRYVFGVRIRGLDKLGDHPGLGLINFTPDVAQLQCGIPGRHRDPDFEQGVLIPFHASDVHKGEFAAGCAVQVKKAGGIRIDAVVFDYHPGRR